jgi:hypothetical protein
MSGGPFATYFGTFDGIGGELLRFLSPEQRAAVAKSLDGILLKNAAGEPIGELRNPTLAKGTIAVDLLVQ